MSTKGGTPEVPKRLRGQLKEVENGVYGILLTV